MGSRGRAIVKLRALSGRDVERWRVPTLCKRPWCLVNPYRNGNAPKVLLIKTTQWPRYIFPGPTVISADGTLRRVARCRRGDVAAQHEVTDRETKRGRARKNDRTRKAKQDYTPRLNEFGAI
ncbi:hypothetical protein KM043_012554 [Ampulex compressa]|nr:hypothetical protein KM043_012554 [Ampulex compressa]